MKICGRKTVFNISYDNKIRCFEAEIEGKIITDGTKSGLLKGKMRIVKEIDMPALTTEQRIYFAIKAAQLVLSPGTIPQFDNWADKWLSGENRCYDAAYAASYAAHADGAKILLLSELAKEAINWKR